MDPIEELDEIFALLENPIRRRLIQRLSETPNFALQLSKELRLAQQLVAKHLQIMENQGFVSSSQERSPRGPKRKLYQLNRHISLRVDVAPHLYNQEITSFKKNPPPPEPKITLEKVQEKINAFVQETVTRKTWDEIGVILTDIDQALSRVSLEQRGFLYLRNRLLRHCSQAMHGLTNFERSVFLRILAAPKISITKLSRQLHIPQEIIHQVISKLKKIGYLD